MQINTEVTFGFIPENSGIEQIDNEPGQFLVEEETGRLYLDVDETKRILLGGSAKFGYGSESISYGKNTMAGCKFTQVTNAVLTDDNKYLIISIEGEDLANSLSKIISGDMVSLQLQRDANNGSNYDCFGTINIIDFDNKIIKIKLEDSEFSRYDTRNTYGTMWFPQKPDQGTYVAGDMVGAFAAGNGAVAAQESSMAFGENVYASGKRSFTAGRENFSGYISASFGRKNTIRGLYSFGSGYQNDIATAVERGVVFGNKNKVRSHNTFVIGNESIDGYNQTLGINYIEGRYNEIANNIEGLNHIEGQYNKVLSGGRNHIEGENNQVSGYTNHIQGKENKVNGSWEDVGGSNNQITRTIDGDSYYNFIRGHNNWLENNTNTLIMGNDNKKIYRNTNTIIFTRTLQPEENTIPEISYNEYSLILGKNHLVSNSENTLVVGHGNRIGRSISENENNNDVVSSAVIGYNNVVDSIYSFVAGFECERVFGSHNYILGKRNIDGNNNFSIGVNNHPEYKQQGLVGNRNILIGNNLATTGENDQIILGSYNAINPNAFLIIGCGDENTPENVLEIDKTSKTIHIFHTNTEDTSVVNYGQLQTILNDKIDEINKNQGTWVSDSIIAGTGNNLDNIKVQDSIIMGANNIVQGSTTDLNLKGQSNIISSTNSKVYGKYNYLTGHFNEIYGNNNLISSRESVINGSNNIFISEDTKLITKQFANSNIVTLTGGGVFQLGELSSSNIIAANSTINNNAYLGITGSYNIITTERADYNSLSLNINGRYNIGHFKGATFRDTLNGGFSDGNIGIVTESPSGTTPAYVYGGYNILSIRGGQISGYQQLILGDNNTTGGAMPMNIGQNVIVGNSNNVYATNNTGGKLSTKQNFVLGESNTIPSAGLSVTIGRSNYTNVSHQFVFGLNNRANHPDDQATVINEDLNWQRVEAARLAQIEKQEAIVANPNSTAAEVSAAKSLINVLTNTNPNAISGPYNLLIGDTNTVAGSSTLSIGSHNIGLNTHHVLMVGHALKSDGQEQLIVGKYNETDYDAAFIVGNGYYSKYNEDWSLNPNSETIYRNAFVVKKDGRAIVQTPGEKDNEVVVYSQVEDMILQQLENMGVNTYIIEHGVLKDNLQNNWYYEKWSTGVVKWYSQQYITNGGAWEIYIDNREEGFGDHNNVYYVGATSNSSYNYLVNANIAPTPQEQDWVIPKNVLYLDVNGIPSSGSGLLVSIQIVCRWDTLEENN